MSETTGCVWVHAQETGIAKLHVHQCAPNRMSTLFTRQVQYCETFQDVASQNVASCIQPAL